MKAKDELLDELNRAFEDYREYFGDEVFYQFSIPEPLIPDAIKRLQKAIATDTPLPNGVVY